MAVEPLRPAFSSAISYRDPKAALRWLEEAFGFEPFMVILDADENLLHSEMRFHDGVIMVGTEWSEDHKSPRSVGGKNTQSVHVHLTEDVNAHCERARRAGAVILQEPADQFYGDRTASITDPFGFVWHIHTHIEDVSMEQMQERVEAMATAG